MVRRLRAKKPQRGEGFKGPQLLWMILEDRNLKKKQTDYSQQDEAFSKDQPNSGERRAVTVQAQDLLHLTPNQLCPQFPTLSPGH